MIRAITQEGVEVTDIRAHFVKNSHDVAVGRDIAERRMKQIRPQWSGGKRPKGSVTNVEEDGEAAET